MINDPENILKLINSVDRVLDVAVVWRLSPGRMRWLISSHMRPTWLIAARRATGKFQPGYLVRW